MKFCQNCGEAIEDTVLICPKCNANTSSNADEEVAVVYNESNDTFKDNSVVPNSKTNNVKKISPVIMKNRKAISIALAIISVICLIVSITTITSDEYIDSSENYSEYMDNYDEIQGQEKKSRQNVRNDILAVYFYGGEIYGS